MLQRHSKTIPTLLRQTGLAFLLFFFIIVGHVHAQVPDYYYPNYQIQQQWDEILDTFVGLEAKQKIGQDPNASTFSSLYASFQSVFPKFPQDSNYKIIYQQCLLLSQSAANGYTYDKFVNFMESCFVPLNSTIKTIGNKFTIKPSVVANPKEGSAPLTVTFDAKGSKDPSNDTIPQDNYFWYFKDIDGIDKTIGQGATVNYTFTTEGTYIVHLTVRSANQSTQGVLDGEKTITVNVGAESANLVVYANGKRLSEEAFTKIGTQEAQRGVTIDGSATQAKGGRTIINHQRKVFEGGTLLEQSEQKTGNPTTFVANLPRDGEYSIELSVMDNENNTLKRRFLLNVSDPIAIITQSPEQGDTQKEFTFDASASYSIKSSIRLYTWEVFNESGDKIYTTQKKSFNQKFREPGTYRVKLIVQDELGESNEEVANVFVDSSTPSPQFTITAKKERDRPSQFTLDASLSSDIDVTNGFDSLSYEWQASDSSNVSFVPLEEGNNSKVLATFDSIGDHEVTLIVTDSYGKTQSAKKPINVKSSLRPRLLINPTATAWGNPVTFAVTSNQDIINYEWDFGNGVTRIVQTNNIQYTYDKAGVYTVKLTATSRDGDSNTIEENVFIGEKNRPTIVYEVTDQTGNLVKQNTSCTDSKGEEHIAFEIERQSQFTLNLSDSVNSKGRNDNLDFFVSPENDEIYTTSRFVHRFREVGCQYISLTVEDTESTVLVEKKAYFKVINALPTIQNITLFFPQFGNESGIGLNQSNIQNIFEGESDELIVKVVAQGAQDFDGQISTFTWYYYNKDDPNRLLEVKANPGNVPYAFFTLSKSALRGDFAFGVRMSDNDGGEITSEEIIGIGPSLFFLPQGNQNIDIPIVTLKTSSINTKVGEEVTFEVVSRILSQRPDFTASRSIEYDFGDGSDKVRTKSPTITHIYEKSGKYTPKVKVTYRSNPGTAYGETISVQNALKASILTTSYDKIVLIRDLSVGEIETSSVCFDRTKCNTPGYIQKNQKEYIKQYASYGDYVIEYNVTDKFGNQATERRLITLKPEDAQNTIFVSSTPETTLIDNMPTIRVGNNLNNEVLIFVHYFDDGLCYVDTNIARDEDGDGLTDNDKSMACNIPKVITYTPELGESQGRIYYEKTIEGIKKIHTQDFVVDFIDYDSVLSSKQKELYFVLSNLISSIDDSLLGNAIIKDELINIRDNLQNDSEISLSLIAIDDYMQDDTIVDKQIILTDGQQSQLDFVKSKLRTTDVLASQGASIYLQSKQLILDYSPVNVKGDIESYFFTLEQLPEPAKNPDLVKEELQKVLTTLTENSASGDAVTVDTISQEEIDLIILPALCDILEYYNIPSALCPDSSAPSINIGQQVNQAATGGILTVVKRIGIVVLVLGGAFLAIVVFFAVRSRVRSGGAPTTPAGA